MGYAALDHCHPHNKGKGKEGAGCRVCGNVHGVIHKYRMNICRRCFRERAQAIGFEKLD